MTNETEKSDHTLDKEDGACLPGKLPEKVQSNSIWQLGFVKKDGTVEIVDTYAYKKACENELNYYRNRGLDYDKQYFMQEVEKQGKKTEELEIENKELNKKLWNIGQQLINSTNTMNMANNRIQELTNALELIKINSPACCHDNDCPVNGGEGFDHGCSNCAFVIACNATKQYKGVSDE